MMLAMLLTAVGGPPVPPDVDPPFLLYKYFETDDRTDDGWGESLTALSSGKLVQSSGTPGTLYRTSPSAHAESYLKGKCSLTDFGDGVILRIATEYAFQQTNVSVSRTDSSTLNVSVVTFDGIGNVSENFSVTGECQFTARIWKEGTLMKVKVSSDQFPTFEHSYDAGSHVLKFYDIALSGSGSAECDELGYAN